MQSNSKAVLRITRLLLLTMICSSVGLAHEHGVECGLDLEATPATYHQLLQRQGLLGPNLRSDNSDVGVSIRAGERLFAWINHINSARTQDPIRLTSEGTQVGYPIDDPRFNSPKIISQQLQSIRSGVDALVRRVIFENEPLSTSTGLDDDEFVRQARLISDLYQRAARWRLQEPSLASYAAKSYLDVRGFYHLRNQVDPESYIRNSNNLPVNEQQQLKEWLRQICMNAKRDGGYCASDLQTAINQNALVAFYQRYLPSAQRMWDGYFEIPSRGRRGDIAYSSANNTSTIPFLDPKSSRVWDFVADNVEDEFQLNGWSLILKKVYYEPAPKIRFVPGVTPNVNGLGGNTITMDANLDIDEYDTKWTIRHEFGHVLGLPDCYVEFYDKTAATMVSYQLDITNIMCSRRGKFNEVTFRELAIYRK